MAGLTRRTVPAADLPFEFALNALRLLQGFEFDLYVERTGLPEALLLPPLQALAGRGLLQQQGSRWQASPLGLRFLNDVIVSFLPVPNSPSGATV